MRCQRCNRKLKTGGYNGTQYGATCYRMLFDPVRVVKVDKGKASEAQADMFGDIILAEKPSFTG